MPERKVKYLDPTRERDPILPEIPEQSREVVLEYAKAFKKLQKMYEWVDWLDSQKDTKSAMRGNTTMALINQKRGQDPRPDLESAVRGIKNSSEDFLQPDEIYDEFIKREAAMGLFDQATTHLSLFKNDLYILKGYGHIIKAKVKAGLSIEEELAYVRGKAESFDHEKDYGAIETACFDFTCAHRVPEALALVQKTTNEKEKMVCLQTIIYCCVQEKLWDEVEIALVQVEDKVFQIKILSYVSTEKTQDGLDGSQELSRAAALAVQLFEESPGEDKSVERRSLQHVAEAYAKQGNFERADYFMTQANLAECHEVVASQKAKYGLFQEAKQTLELVKNQEIYEPLVPHPKLKTGFTHIALEEVKAGKLDDAFETVMKIQDQYQRLFAYLFIAEAQYDQGNDFSQALKFAYEEKQKITRTNTYQYLDVIKHIAITEAHVGHFYGATSLATKELLHEHRNKTGFPRIIATLLEITGPQVVVELNKGRDALAAITPDQMAAFVQRALCDEDINFVQGLGHVLNLGRKQQVLKLIQEPDRTTVRRLFNLGKSEMAYMVPESRSNLHRELIQDVGDFEKKTKDELKELEYWRREFQIIIDTFNTLPPDIAKRILLDAVRAFPLSMDHPILPRLFQTLVKMNMEKGNETILDLALDESCPRHLAWHFLAKLEEVGYIVPGCFEYLKTSRQAKKLDGAAEKIVAERADLKLLRLIRDRIKVNPDVAVIKLIRESSFTDAAGQLIDPLQFPEKVIEAMSSWKKEFEAIESRDALIEALASDKNKAALYYVLHGGQYRFAAVNSYSAEKFFVMIQYLKDLNYDQEPEQSFVKALVAHGSYDSAEAESLVAKLHAGEWPLSGKNTWTVRLDVSDTHALENLHAEARLLFGKQQLGTLVKAAVYPLALKDAKDKRFSRALASNSGVEKLCTTVALVEQHHPDFSEVTRRKLSTAWDKLSAQQIVPPLDAAFTAEGYDMNFDVMVKQLEQYRKATLQTTRQKKGLEKAELSRQIELLENASPSKVMCLAVEQALKESGVILTKTELLGEWESHLEGIFTKYIELRQQDGSKVQKQEKTVTLRYLDKKQDLAAAVHFADAASSCFTSDNNFHLLSIDASRAKWVARLYKDPLSHIFLIEDNPPDASERVAIGFVFGSFGLNKEDEPIDLLNGVYLQSGKTDIGVQSIVNSLEKNFVIPLRLSEMYIATRHGGTARLAEEFTNGSQEVNRLCALKDRSGNDIRYIYDDLNLQEWGVTRTDPAVWHKRTRTPPIEKKKSKFSDVMTFFKGLFRRQQEP